MILLNSEFTNKYNITLYNYFIKKYYLGSGYVLVDI